MQSGAELGTEWRASHTQWMLLSPSMLHPMQAHDQGAQDDLEDALATCSLEDLHHCIGEPETMPGTSHKLIHLLVDPAGSRTAGAYTGTSASGAAALGSGAAASPAGGTVSSPAAGSAAAGYSASFFDRKLMVVASRYVADQLAERAANSSLSWLVMLVNLSMSLPVYRAAAGAFFESYAHRRLQQGGSFPVGAWHLLTLKSLSCDVAPRRIFFDNAVDCMYLDQVRQLGHVCSGSECLDLKKAERIQSFDKVEDVANTPDGVYCLPKVGGRWAF